MAGPMLWPSGEPWPRCQLPHMVEIERPATAEDLELFRRGDEEVARLADRLSALPPEPGSRGMPAATAAQLLRMLASASANRPRTTVRTSAMAVPPKPVPMVPVVQLRAADIPHARFPEGTDLLQILWCPHWHNAVPGMDEHHRGPAPMVCWRDSTKLTHHATPPDGAGTDGRSVLSTCVISPEQITDYPDTEALPDPLQERLEDWHDSLGPDPGFDYRNDLAAAPGLKAGGWPYWPHGPRPVGCACGADRDLLLSIPNGERGTPSWTPLEDQTRAVEGGEEFHHPTGFHGARDAVHIFSCRQDPAHPVQIYVE
ncbi:hypothetical protein SAMN05421773_107221 [Streptomyces aidingensis]|uniref:DUF1963 domain-containing protein n=1 Tax=Streptomyces aidingensis TaxID=910347 RepID=A0A1I1NFS8_9ACTN|nr:hypothetical protein SAMN05421773_107221 [Streptomyces aidingensis]